MRARGFKDEQGNPQTSRKMSFHDFSNSPVMPKMLITYSQENAVLTKGHKILGSRFIE